MRVLMAAVALVLSVGLGGVASQAPDKFVAGCPLPFFGIQDHHSIDSICQNQGQAKVGDDPLDAANEEQNRTKNNFCVVGTPALATRKTFDELQKRIDQLKASTAGTAHPFTYGTSGTLPTDRAPIRATSFYTNSEGEAIHEGAIVHTVAFLLHGKYSDQSTGEGVNCYVHGVANNDIHLTLVQTKAEANAATPDECRSFTAEITPHFRPEPWLILSTLHKAGTKTAKEKIAAADLDRPLRITGQMMMDGSHKACVNGSGGSLKRISVWEIHPVYGIDVCKKTSIAQCRVGVDDDWKSLAEFMEDDQ